jgi:SAM-dependent methyltransferase
MVDENATIDSYRRFAGFYDLEHASFGADLHLYRQFALQANGPILELGCGSGRVLAALEELGLPLTGIDSSPAMLDLARQRLSRSTSLALCAIESVGDCTELPHRPYWMAFSAINTFLHLPDADAQIAALSSLRQVMVTGAILLLDLMVPEPHYLASLDGRVQHELSADLDGGRRLDKFAARTHDLASQTITTTVFFDLTDRETGVIRRTADQYVTRYIHRWELEHLLERSGWRLVSLYGSYDLEEFDSDSERMIALATWGEMSADNVEGKR